MPPKVKFTREEVIAAALEIVRSGGMAALTARTLASRLGSSPKPVFGLFENMQEVQDEVMRAAFDVYKGFLETEMARGKYPLYKASGMAYIDFARREKELFKLLFMRDRSAEQSRFQDDSIDGIIAIIMDKTGLSRERAAKFHQEMWLFVHGIATMIVTGYLDWDEEYVSGAVTDVFFGVLMRWQGGAT